MIIQIIGLGYVGLTTALLLSQNKNTVYGYDKDPVIVDMINANRYWYNDFVLLGLLEEVLKKNLRVKNKIIGGDIYVIAVQTEVADTNKPNLEKIHEALKSIILLLKDRDMVIIESTIPYGYLAFIENEIYMDRKELIGNIDVIYCPERLGVGDSLEDIRRNNRIVGGNSEKSIERGVSFYKKIIHADVYGVDSGVAEISKLTENSLRDVQLAFANQISMICAEKNINIWDVMKCVNSHEYINMLKPSIGVGGGCVPINPYYLINEFPDNTDLLRVSRCVNDRKKEYCYSYIIDCVEEYVRRRSEKPVVAFMGLAYKPNVADYRKSVAMEIVERISVLGICKPIFVDPYFNEYGYFEIIEQMQAIKIADIIVYLVAHDIFKSINPQHGKIVIDFVGVANYQTVGV